MRVLFELHKHQPELLPKGAGLIARNGQGLLLEARYRLETLPCMMQAGAGPADLPADMQVRNRRSMILEACTFNSFLLRIYLPVLGKPRLRTARLVQLR